MTCILKKQYIYVVRRRRWILIGDVVSSRDVESRAELREAIQAVCRDVNQLFVENIAAPFRILKGVDEVGGALGGPQALYDVVDRFQGGLAPVEIRLAAARDVVDIGWSTGDVAQMDGPAFHRCARLIEEMRKTDSRFDVSSGDLDFDQAAGAQIEALWLLKQSWTPRQRETYELAQREPTQSTIADRLGISQQAVSHSLRAARATQVSRIESSARAWLASQADRLLDR